jgi:RNAse (barnase) inhibitor barstar
MPFCTQCQFCAMDHDETGSDGSSTEPTTIILDASSWKTQDDFYTSFFMAVGAPSWHGRNLDALNDSVRTGSINELERPYSIIIVNYGNLDDSARNMADNFVEFFRNDLDTPVQIINGNVLPQRTMLFAKTLPMLPEITPIFQKRWLIHLRPHTHSGSRSTWGCRCLQRTAEGCGASR